MSVAQMLEDRFVIDEVIGRGGMGIVYLGRDTKTGLRVAIKALRSDLAGARAGWLERFRREGEALRELNHPNIVKMLATCEEGRQHFIVMEYLDGGSLAELLEIRGPLPLEEVTGIALQLADALTRAHYLKIVHRLCGLAPGARGARLPTGTRHWAWRAGLSCHA